MATRFERLIRINQKLTVTYIDRYSLDQSTLLKTFEPITYHEHTVNFL